MWEFFVYDSENLEWEFSWVSLAFSSSSFWVFAAVYGFLFVCFFTYLFIFAFFFSFESKSHSAAEAGLSGLVVCWVVAKYYQKYCWNTLI